MTDLQCTEWDGVTMRDSYKPAVVAARDRLADAARDGAWAVVLELVGAHPDWVNTARVGGRSGYAPLHQAAWRGAGRDVVEQLVSLGAWRTLRASSGERPIDIASTRGHAQLRDLLEPAVRQDVPAAALGELERRLHPLIGEVSHGRAASHQLRLPQLEILTELPAGTRVYFPVPGMYGGFSFWLDRDALIVESWSRVVEGSGLRHRITSGGTALLESGFV